MPAIVKTEAPTEEEVVETMTPEEAIRYRFSGIQLQYDKDGNVNWPYTPHPQVHLPDFGYHATLDLRNP